MAPWGINLTLNVTQVSALGTYSPHDIMDSVGNSHLEPCPLP